MLNYLLPRSLRKLAISWYNHAKPFVDWASFKKSFLAELFSFNYTLDIEQEIQSAYQSRGEPLTRFARRMKELFQRLDQPPTQQAQSLVVVRKFSLSEFLFQSCLLLFLILVP